ncbi:MAG: hypothetical protein KDI67_00710 [Gammaproteobacteria bacterium]|nr:hypothetical protein [Gammaproteobacteria bacterium]
MIQAMVDVMPQEPGESIADPACDIGGFTKDAKYEADRGSIPVVLLDPDDLSNEIVRHYGEMDMDARSLIPLTTILWPA